MDDFLTPVSTSYRSSRSDGPAIQEVNDTKQTSKIETVPDVKISSLEDALSSIKGQPDYKTLVAVLQFLVTTHRPPSPQTAAISHALVTEILPNYWDVLSEDARDAENDVTGDGTKKPLGLLIEVLQDVTGLNALVAHMKSLVREFKQAKAGPSRTDITLHIETILSAIAAILQPDNAIHSSWMASVQGLGNVAMRKLQSQNLVSLIASGKLVSLVSEAHETGIKDELRVSINWITDGAEYSRWLGRNICQWIKQSSTDEDYATCFDIIQRSMSLGYSDTLLRVLFDNFLLCRDSNPGMFTKLCFFQPQRTKKIMDTLLQYLAQRHLSSVEFDSTASNPIVSAAAAILRDLIQDDQNRRSQLVSWCASSTGAGLGDGIGIRRAVLAALAQDKDAIVTVFEKSLQQFGDPLYIRHTAILQQEVHAQILLLSAGYLQRSSPIKLTLLMRSGPYLSAISNRIASTQSRARFLGMIVGESLSTLMDKKETKLAFDLEEMETDEADWFKSLSSIADAVGPVDPILSNAVIPSSQPRRIAPSKKNNSHKQQQKQRAHTKPGASSTPKAIIEEIDSESEDEDLVPYAKGSDPEDSDDDATLVQRDKIKQPVYIRDLIAFFRDSESYDKQKLAINTAPVLIRRKANYGTELSSHADELATLLVGLQDKFELEDFGDLKLQSMIALIVSQPKAMAPWFARSFFEGDLSLSQRTTVLISIGLSARELAGFDISAYKSTASFASKQLPAKIEQLYLDPSKSDVDVEPASQLKALPQNAIDSIAQSLTTDFLAPVAAEAADSATGPDVLKMQSFSTRYKRKNMAKPQKRSIPNTTATLLTSSFFYPLTAYFQFALRSSKPIILNPAMLALYLQTLGIIIHSAGPSTLSLPQLTTELWDLLLGVRVHVSSDLGALKGWLVAMAALIEVNEKDMRRICESQGREVMETREWVSGVFERTRGGDGGEENDVKMLAAGVLIKLGEAIEQYQALLMGDMIGYS